MRTLAIVSAVTLLAICALAGPAAAGPGKIELEARTEPAELAPGGTGTLVIKGTMGPELHIYATDKGGKIPLTWKPIEAEGVTYDVAAATRSKHSEFKEPDFGDIEGERYDAWKGSFEIRVPIKLSKDVKAGTVIGGLFGYQACTDDMCYSPQTGQRVAAKIVLGAGTAQPGAKPKDDGKPAAGAKPRMPRPFEHEDVVVEVALAKDGKALLVTITPQPGNKIYGEGAMEGIPVAVKPIEDDGIEWGKVSVPFSAGTHDPLTITVPFTRTTAETAEMRVSWQVCNDEGQCQSPDETRMVIHFTPPPAGNGAKVDEPEPPVKEPDDPPKDEPAKDKPAKDKPAADEPAGDDALVFPVVEDDDLQAEENLIGTFYKDYGLLVLGLIFVLGAGLAFTPCVLPIIPITVAVVTGGRSDLPRKRLFSLLSTYVLSMALTFGVFGAIAGAFGTTMSAAFQEPAVIWGIGALFLVLAFGMLGVIELQPPQWMTKLQGNAQQRGGSLLGAALLGCVMAFVASPCTGPFIVAMSVVLATTKSIPLGFAMFFAMGLGMGAVLFAFGALNFALRPGPWMVWVRYGFGMLLFGGALYYVSNAELLLGPALWITALLGAILAGVLVARHLVKAEGEQTPIARARGAKVAGLFVAVAALVIWITLPPTLPDNVDPELVAFQKIEDVDHLKELVADNVEQDRATIVDVWGTWCTYCKKWENVLKQDDRLRHEFSKVARLKIDVSTDNRPDLRDALGIPRGTQPFFVFIDGEGRIRRAADVDRWYDTAEARQKKMLERLRLVLGDEFGIKETGRPWRYGGKGKAAGDVKEEARQSK